MKKTSRNILFIIVVVSLFLSACSGEIIKDHTQPGNTTTDGGPTFSEVNVWDSGNFSSLQPIRTVVIQGTNAYFMYIYKDFDPATATAASAIGLYGRSFAIAQSDTPGFGPMDVLAIVSIAGSTYFAVLYYSDTMPEPEWTVSTANWNSFVADAQRQEAVSKFTGVTFGNYQTMVPAASYGNGNFQLSLYNGLSDTDTTVYLYETALASESSLVGVYSAMGTTYYATNAPVAGSSTSWTMTSADWFLFTRLAVMAGTTTAAPPISWPAWDPNTSGWQHAAQSRKWPIQGIMLAYEALTHTADHVYFSPTLGYLLITTYDPYVGSIGSIFTAANDVIGAGGSAIVPGAPVTIIFPMQSLQAKRVRGCFSYEIWPAFGTYTSMFDPPPVGSGTCKQGNQ